ncbi:uncharacterized protein ACA1_264250 [Acanthamoeba castellanii str. Neff]|uniref:Uncharacterized protein n=1 Tax=Acanthamoeba castellanii (strain ATCC 30010 / Neff) TaxID=1257118 RepID=L8H175_ACACF|nr:uncharacterized protein ACA1_264250 [Acanthamoeba castellanii str. Neff]ELR19254.1 hypothetical protein ACA1_264250 [Acanthamoeba castellanii str. Neff]
MSLPPNKTPPPPLRHLTTLLPSAHPPNDGHQDAAPAPSLAPLPPPPTLFSMAGLPGRGYPLPPGYPTPSGASPMQTLLMGPPGVAPANVQQPHPQVVQQLIQHYLLQVQAQAQAQIQAQAQAQVQAQVAQVQAQAQQERKSKSDCSSSSNGNSKSSSRSKRNSARDRPNCKTGRLTSRMATNPLRPNQARPTRPSLRLLHRGRGPSQHQRALWRLLIGHRSQAPRARASDSAQSLDRVRPSFPCTRCSPSSLLRHRLHPLHHRHRLHPRVRRLHQRPKQHRLCQRRRRWYPSPRRQCQCPARRPSSNRRRIVMEHGVGTGKTFFLEMGIAVVSDMLKGINSGEIKQVYVPPQELVEARKRKEEEAALRKKQSAEKARIYRQRERERKIQQREERRRIARERKQKAKEDRLAKAEQGEEEEEDEDDEEEEEDEEDEANEGEEDAMEEVGKKAEEAGDSAPEDAEANDDMEEEEEVADELPRRRGRPIKKPQQQQPKAKEGAAQERKGDDQVRQEEQKEEKVANPPKRDSCAELGA